MGVVPFRSSSIAELTLLITSSQYSFPEQVSFAAMDLITGVLQTNPNNRITIKDILEHTWFSDYVENVEILTQVEKDAMRDEFHMDNAQKDDCSMFTEHKLDTTNGSINANELSKSNVLAPFNTPVVIAECFNVALKNKSIINYSHKVKELNRQYEKNSNSKMDNGIYNKMCLVENQTEKNAESVKPIQKDKKSKPILYQPKPLSIDYKTLKIVESYGFPLDYIQKSLISNDANHATACYYLLLDKSAIYFR